MKRNPGQSHRSIMVFLVALPLLLGSCSTWRPISVPPDAVAREKHPRRVRATLADHRVVTIGDAQFAGDTLYGQHNALIQDSGGKYAWADSVAIPTDQIVNLEARRRSAGKTILLILVIPVALGLGISMTGGIFD
jgi:hypothetical protein